MLAFGLLLLLAGLIFLAAVVYLDAEERDDQYPRVTAPGTFEPWQIHPPMSDRHSTRE